MKKFIKEEYRFILMMLMGFGGLFIAMFGITLNKDMIIRQQIFACIGFAMIALSFPLDSYLETLEDKNKKEKQ